MAAIPNGVEPSTAQAMGGNFDPLPEGKYPAMLTKESNIDTGIEFEFDIISGEFQGRKIFAKAEWSAPEEWRRENSEKLLGALFRSLGLLGKQDFTEVLMHKSFVLVVNKKPSKKDPTKIYNNVTDVESMTPVAVAPAPVAAPTPAPAPLPVAAAPAVAPAPAPAPPAEGPAPWA